MSTAKTHSQPNGTSHLRLWFAGSDRLLTELGALCEVNSLRVDNWERQAHEIPPSFLLVEAANGVDTAWGSDLDQLLERCRALAVPRLLWITASPLNRFWRDRCARFDRVFTVDRGQSRELEEAGVVDPAVLWPAARLPATPPPPEGYERPYSVLWLGGWREDWPQAWREQLSSVLRGAAERGLRIVATSDITGLPLDLRDCVAHQNGHEEDAYTELRRAKVVIGADPTFGARLLAPAVIFDAAVSGGALITPHDFASLHDFALGGTPDIPWRNLVPVVHDRNAVVDEIDQLLSDELLRHEVVAHMRRIVANNHTYAHRLATLASAAGYRLIPDAHHPAPA